MDAQGQAFASVSGGEAPGANPLIPFFGYPLSANQLVNPAYNLPHEVWQCTCKGFELFTFYRRSVCLTDKTLRISIKGRGATLTDVLHTCNANRSPFMSITLQALIVEADEWPVRLFACIIDNVLANTKTQTRVLMPWYHTDKAGFTCFKMKIPYIWGCRLTSVGKYGNSIEPWPIWSRSRAFLDTSPLSTNTNPAGC